MQEIGGVFYENIKLQPGTLTLNLKLKNRLDDLLQQLTIDADYFFGRPCIKNRYHLYAIDFKPEITPYFSKLIHTNKVQARALAKITRLFFYTGILLPSIGFIHRSQPYGWVSIYTNRSAKHYISLRMH